MYPLVLSSRQQEYISSTDVEINPMSDPRSKLSAFVDVVATAAAIWAPLAYNHFVVKGSGMLFQPLYEVFNWTLFIFLVTTSGYSVIVHMMDSKRSRKVRCFNVLSMLVFITFHFFLSYFVITMAMEV